MKAGDQSVPDYATKLTCGCAANPFLLRGDRGPKRGPAPQPNGVGARTQSKQAADCDALRIMNSVDVLRSLVTGAALGLAG
jgi:hypothetical protein